MVRRILLSLLIPLSACAAWYLRRGKLSLSFSGTTQWDWALWGMLGAVALLTLLLALPEKNNRPLSSYRPVSLGTVLQGAGALLVTAGGAWQFCQLYPAPPSLQAAAALAMLLGGLALFGGTTFFLGARHRGGSFLPLSMCAAGLYLVLTYPQIASDPFLFRFDTRMLAVGMASLALVFLCSLLFTANGKRRFLLFSALTVPFSVSALYTAESFPQSLGLMGISLAAYGFFLSVLFGIPCRQKQNYELINDPFRTDSVPREELRQAKAAEEDAAAPAPAEKPVPVEKAACEPVPAENAAAEPASAQDTVSAPAISDAPTVETSAPQPAYTDDFDLARVDRLLCELGLDSTEDQ